MPEPLLIAQSKHAIALLPALASRHGLITGATGTGKTVTLQIMAERFSASGVPVFMADVKGDLSGLAAAGADSPKMPLGAQILWEVLAAGPPCSCSIRRRGFGSIAGFAVSRLSMPATSSSPRRRSRHRPSACCGRG